MKIKLYIGSELADFNEAFNVLFSIGDVRELSFGNCNKTYTFNLPLTNTNKRLIKYINEASVKTEVSSTAWLYLDEQLIISGPITVLGSSDYFAKVIINSDDWIENLKNLKLTDLDLSAYDHALTHANVENSWSASYPFYRYPMINFGALVSGETGASAKWTPNDFIPMFQIAGLITKILAPYTITSTFLGLGAIKDLYILARERIADEAFIKDKTLLAVPTNGSANTLSWNIDGLGRQVVTKTFDPVVFNTITTDEGSDFVGNVYTVPATGTYRFKFTCKGSLSSVPNEYSTVHSLSIRYYLYTKAGGAGSPVALASLVVSSTSFSDVAITRILDSWYVHLSAGDTVYCVFEVVSDIENLAGSQETYTLLVDHTAAKFENIWDRANLHTGLNKTIEAETMLPDMTQIDFLAAIRDIFNLRFWLDKQKRVMYIEPWDSFVSSSVIDLSDYIDHESKPFDLISESYSKNIVFKWKDDTADKAYEEYLKSADSPGQKKITLASLYARDGINTKEHPFSSIVTGWGWSIVGGSPAKIYRDYITATPTVFNRMVNFNTRIVEWKGLTAGFSWNYDTETKTEYPKILGLDWNTIYTSYLMKFYHYIDKGKLFTYRMKLKPGMLSQFMTVVSTATSEGFRPTYKIGDDYYFLQKITTDGDRAECELILKV